MKAIRFCQAQRYVGKGIESVAEKEGPSDMNKKHGLFETKST